MPYNMLGEVHHRLAQFYVIHFFIMENLHTNKIECLLSNILYQINLRYSGPEQVQQYRKINKA